MTPKVFFYVQHLLGIGHLVRATRVARALSRAGFAVDLVVGGTPVLGLDIDGARLVQLPPVKAAPDFSTLVDAEGRAMDEAGKAARCRHLLAAFEASRPDILLIEAFPFGRAQMRFELIPLLERARAATPRPLIAVSIRDILQRGRKPQRLEETALVVERFVDLVLVHGDPQLVRLAATFPLADRFAEKTVYTGIVGPDSAETNDIAEHDVIVSTGGGAVGERLVRAALEARPRSELRDARWLIVTGPNFPADAAARLAAETAGVALARFVRDLPQRLRRATLSISQAGYNTVADVLAAKCRAVLAPYASFGESEQSDRARLLEARGLAAFIEDAELDGPRLAEAIARAMRLPEPNAAIDIDGASKTAAILHDELSDRAS